MRRAALIPCLRYADAPAAIDFLCRAFGFARHIVHADMDNPRLVHHAELTLHDQMLMLASARPDDLAALYGFKTPSEARGVTMSICALVPDPDTHAAVAAREGATILRPPAANPGFPGRAYDALDPEGNAWNFNSYDPWGG